MTTIAQNKNKEEKPALHFPALQPPRRYLFGPGPSMVHPRVYEALAKPIVGHLDPYFIQVMGDVQQLLKTAFGTSDGVTLVVSGTGSAGMEAAVANFVEPGTKLAVFANGYFSDRLTEMARRHGANVVRLEKLGVRPIQKRKRESSSVAKGPRLSLMFTPRPRPEPCNRAKPSALPLTMRVLL